MKVGVPYARLQRDAAGWFKTCPICGVRIATVEKKDFESFTGSEYAAHILTNHPDA